ncbi:hypothetical protein, partial [Bartonella henselae]
MFLPVLLFSNERGRKVLRQLMIKMFRNHVCLCTVTTAILSFLQIGTGGGASAGEGRNDPYTITVTPLFS